jgi:hypothetical protein
MVIVKFGVKHQGEMGKLLVQNHILPAKMSQPLISAAKMGTH